MSSDRPTGGISLAIPAQPEYLSLVRAVVAAAAALDPGLGDARIEDLRIAVSEATTNAIEAHANLGSEERITIRCDLADDRIEVEVQDHAESGFDPCLRVRARAHLELANIGSRVAIADLRESLNRDDTRVDLDLVDAVAKIGKRDELSILLRAWQREDPFTRRRIADAVRAIMKRERIRRNAKILRTLQPGELSTLLRIMPPAAVRRNAARKRR